MLKLKKTFCTTLIFLLLFCFSVTSFAQSFVKITSNTEYAMVLEVLSGESIKVQLSGNKKIAYVRIKGIDSKGQNGAYEYLINEILGENVLLIKDSSSKTIGRWNYSDVLLNGRNIGNELILSGLAVIDKSQDKGSYYKDFLHSQEIAQSDELGMWKYASSDYSSIDGEGTSNNFKAKVNINTASEAQLQSMLRLVSKDLAKEIIEYRSVNPFSNIKETKFVKGFSAEIFNRNKHFMVVSTNINKASEYELKTLNDLSDSKINKIIQKRATSDINNISDLVPNILDYEEYNKIKPYISTSDKDEIDYTLSSSIVNINTSDKKNLMNAGISFSNSDEIINNRKNGYTFKTLMEISKIGKKNITEKDLNSLEDNLKLLTNLNSQNKEELVSVFGISDGKKVYDKTFKNTEELKSLIGEYNYEKFKDVVYVDKLETDYLNINTATKEQMAKIGLNTGEINQITSARPITEPANLPINIERFNSKVSLYTNINKASKTELYSLGLDNNIINTILEYRNIQPFGSLDEIKFFFDQNSKNKIFNTIEGYLVIR